MHRLTSDEIIRLRGAISVMEHCTVNPVDKEALQKLSDKFEYGCGVDVRTCEEETQRILNEELEED